MSQISDLAAANAYFKRFNDQASTEYNLNNMLKLMAYLGNPQDSIKILHVAGTSGKTSTAYYLAALLAAAGQKTGLTVSPHVDKVNERLQLNGKPLPEADFCQALSEFSELVEKSPVRPSSFELKVAFAFWFYSKEQVDYAVIEVGLGGLKDATNVINRADKICVITDIGLDHVKILGGSLATIAAQKAGIIHKGNDVFTHRQAPAIMKVFNETAAREGAKLTEVTNGENLDPTIPDYQWRNWQLARQVYEAVARRDGLPPLSEPQLWSARHITVPGRMDARQVGDKTIVMDGAHNAQKMQAFVNSFRKLYLGTKPAVLLAMRTGKAYQAIAPILAPLASRVVTTTFTSSQDLPVHSVPPDELAEAFEGLVPVKSVANQHAAYQELLNGPEEVCVITGSIYMLGQIRNNENLA